MPLILLMSSGLVVYKSVGILYFYYLMKLNVSIFSLSRSLLFSYTLNFNYLFTINTNWGTHRAQQIEQMCLF